MRSVFAADTGSSRQMKATDIEEAISQLAGEPFDAAEFPFQLLAAFGNKETTLKRLRSGSSNASDVEGGLLQRSNIHIAVCGAGAVGETLKTLRSSPATLKAKAKFVLATDGDMLEVEELATGEAKICKLADLPKAFGLMLPLAGISAVRQIKDNPIDIRATNKLNKLYVELLKENPDWDGEARRADLNQFMARLIFCFFAESTGIFKGDHLFTKAIEQFTASDSSNTHEVIAELFRAMDTKIEDRGKAKIRPFADDFPYVNGGLFTKRNEVPKFSRIARSYLVNAGSLTWREINPDIFGSMIQAVAGEDERGELGMHYTSVPNILKVLNPLFLDDLREKLKEAGDNRRKLQNLRKRMTRIRVFDPACGSGNFLVIPRPQCAARSQVQGLHLRPEARGDAQDQARTAPQGRRRTRHRPSQGRAPHGPQLSLAPPGGRCQRRPRRRRLQLPPPHPLAQPVAAPNPHRFHRRVSDCSSLKPEFFTDELVF